MAEDLQGAGVGYKQATNKVHEGGLTRPIRTEQADKGTPRHIQAQPIEGPPRTPPVSELKIVSPQRDHGEFANRYL